MLINPNVRLQFNTVLRALEGKEGCKIIIEFIKSILDIKKSREALLKELQNLESLVESTIEYQKKMNDAGIAFHSDFDVANSMWIVGVCYTYGIGVTKDLEKGIKLYKQASPLGSAFAMNDLGFAYGTGSVIEKDQKRAIELYEQAAKQGLAIALNNLAGCYEDGDGSEKNAELAQLLYIQAADKGYPVAQYRLGLWYQWGSLNVKKDTRKALEYYTIAAQQDFLDAISRLVSFPLNEYGDAEDITDIIKNGRRRSILIRFKTDGFPENQSLLIELLKEYDFGIQDIDQGFVKLFHQNGLINAGVSHQLGIGTPINLTTALNYYKQALQQLTFFSDALFCYQMMSFIYEQGGPNFSQNLYRAYDCFYDMSILTGFNDDKNNNVQNRVETKIHFKKKDTNENWLSEDWLQEKLNKYKLLPTYKKHIHDACGSFFSDPLVSIIAEYAVVQYEPTKTAKLS